jgi:hypothetical protein
MGVDDDQNGYTVRLCERLTGHGRERGIRIVRR